MAAVASENKLFIGGLSWNTTAERLEQYFSNFGQVETPPRRPRLPPRPAPALPDTGVSLFGQAWLLSFLNCMKRLRPVRASTSPHLWRQVLEAFVSYDRVTGRPRGFGFVVFEDPAVADRVASLQHTIDRREVETLALHGLPRSGQPLLPLVSRLRRQPAPLGAPATPVRHLLRSRSTPVRITGSIALPKGSHGSTGV